MGQVNMLDPENVFEYETLLQQDCYDMNKLSLEFSNRQDNMAVRLPLKFECILTLYHTCVIN